MAKANKGPSGHKVAIGFGLIGSLVIVMCWGGCSALSSSGDGGKRATGADQQVASTESPATSTLRVASPTPAGTANGGGGPAATPGATPTATPSKATPTKASAKPTPKKTTAKPKPKPKPSKTTSKPVYYKNCAAVRAAGKAPIYRGQPGYGKHLDRDGDGKACE